MKERTDVQANGGEHADAAAFGESLGDDKRLRWPGGQDERGTSDKKQQIGRPVDHLLTPPFSRATVDATEFCAV
jgi:hypothetical protein